MSGKDEWVKTKIVPSFTHQAYQLKKVKSIYSIITHWQGSFCFYIQIQTNAQNAQAWLLLRTKEKKSILRSTVYVWSERLSDLLHTTMDGRMDGWMDGWSEAWMENLINELIKETEMGGDEVKQGGRKSRTDCDKK